MNDEWIKRRKKSSRLNSIFTFISEFYNYNSNSRKETIMTNIYLSQSEIDGLDVTQNNNKRPKVKNNLIDERLGFPIIIHFNMIVYIARKFISY
jgi:hypothetical protein